MFSGIIQGQGTILALEDTPSGKRCILGLEANLSGELSTGASVSVDGVCLTVVTYQVDPNSKNERQPPAYRLTFDVVEETLSKTTLKNLKEECSVNIERSLRFGQEVGGHLCSGHVDGVAKVLSVKAIGEGREIEFEPPSILKKYLFERGYVALNGASITLARLTERGFVVALIPETLRATNLGELQDGSEVNIEVDRSAQVIVDTVERMRL